MAPRVRYPTVLTTDIQRVMSRVSVDNVRTIRFLYCDHGNVIRGKTAHVSALPDFLESGIGLTVAMQAFSVVDHLASGTNLGAVGEIRLVPDPRTYAVLPYASREARLLCDMYTLDGQQWDLCPRTFLHQMIDRAGQHGLRVEAAFEYEFYLARQIDDGRFVPADDSLCFSSDGMDRQSTVIGAILDALDQQGLQPRQYYPELGPAQQELSIQHAPLLEAADRQVAVRETVRAVSLQHGLIASFAPKPFADAAGSGCHVHLSLWNGDQNMLYDAAGEFGLSRLGRSFVAGILQHLPGMLALTCPSVNSYMRLLPNAWSSAYTCWGPDNREAAVRVASPFQGRIEASTNIEIKAVDGSANPYLALGAIVAAGIDGIERNLDPGEPLSSNPHDLDDATREARGIKRYPTTLIEAVTELEQDEVLLAALGANRAHEFIGVRRAEWADLGRASIAQQIAAHFRRY
ncbi:MAG: glutamine synthetase [Chloroflexi bacterium]|nr:glutamine synthetase [Chloroflexota bacterium]MBV9134537.1 glutamine synthetase [Chloroflexota bacterium]MBV9898060.1 glutamine synthetase [Chloroflexota bacterium]